MIELECPGCGHALRIANKYAGLKGKCRYCQTRFNVPLVIVVDPREGHAPVGSGEGGEAVQGESPGSYSDSLSAMIERPEGDDVVLVDPGADRLAELRYGRGRGSIVAPIGISIIVVVLVFGLAFWFMGDGEEQSTFIDRDLVGDIATYSTVVLAGVDVVAYGNDAFSEIDSVSPNEGPLAEVSEEGLASFEALVKGAYLNVVSDYQLALTELGWDFVIVNSESGKWTELYGDFEERDVSLAIHDEGTNVRVIFVTESN